MILVFKRKMNQIAFSRNNQTKEIVRPASSNQSKKETGKKAKLTSHDAGMWQFFPSILLQINFSFCFRIIRKLTTA
jgi:hypothetical protein